MQWSEEENTVWMKLCFECAITFLWRGTVRAKR